MTARVEPGRHGPRSAAPTERLRGAVVGMVLGLLLQYAVGMLVNLFTHIPVHHSGHHSPSFFAGVAAVVPWAIGQGGALAVHASFGLLLALNALFIFVSALRTARGALAWLGGVGLLAVVGAGFNGASFLIYNANQSSLVMAWLFAIAVLCYVLALVRLPAR